MGITVKRTKTDNIWLFDYTSLSGLSEDQDKVIFLSERDLNIIYQGLKDIDRFITRIFVSVTGNMYTSVDNEQFEIFKQWQADLFNHLGDWRVTNEILTRIAEAIEEIDTMSGCCGGVEGADGGSSGAGMEPAAPSGVEDTEESHGGPPPPGFSDWDEFDQDKCNWASYALDQMMVDVLTMSSINVAGQSSAALAAILVTLLVTPVGWIILLEIALIMISATLTVGFYSWIHTHLEENKEEYVCALLNGTDVSSSIANFSSAVDTLVAADDNFNALTGYWASTIIRNLATIDSINRLYDKQPFTPPMADCSACAGDILAYADSVPCPPEASNETGHFFDGIEVTLEACEGNFFGTTRTGFTVISNPPASNIDRHITLISASGLSNYYLQPYYEGVAGAGIGLTSAELPGYEIDCSILTISTPTPSDTTPFNVTLMVEEIV